MKNTHCRLEMYWDDSLAEYSYKLVWTGKYGNLGYFYNASGDLKWAQKIAKHYKIDIPEKEK